MQKAVKKMTIKDLNPHQRSLYRMINSKQQKIQKMSSKVGVGYQYKFAKMFGFGRYLVYYKYEGNIESRLDSGTDVIPSGVFDVVYMEEFKQINKLEFQFKYSGRVLRWKAENEMDLGIWHEGLKLMTWINKADGGQLQKENIRAENLRNSTIVKVKK